MVIEVAKDAERMLKDEDEDRRIAEIKPSQAQYDASLAERRYAAGEPALPAYVNDRRCLRTGRCVCRNIRSGPVIEFRREEVSSVKAAWRKARERTRLDAECNPYSLRHTVGRLLRAHSVPALQRLFPPQAPCPNHRSGTGSAG